MPGFVVDSASMISCFHQAPAPLAPVPRVLLSTSPVATVPPTGPRIPVTGCPFQVPVPGGTKPQPCVTIEWANVSTRVKVMTQPLYLQALPPNPGNGLCKSIEPIPQGAPTLKKLQTRVFAV
jgi:hypothetical protein